MSSDALPAGHYLTIATGLRPDAGGQTRASLLRNRILAEAGGITPTIATVGAYPEQEQRRAELIERGLLLEHIPMHNLYDHYRVNGWGEGRGTGRGLPHLEPHRVKEELRADGRPWRLVHEQPGTGGRLVYDYLRDDGTPYLRQPRFAFRVRSTWPTSILRVDRYGEVLGEFTSLGQLYRRFVHELAGRGTRAFVFTDSPHLPPHLAPMAESHIHLIHVLHNMHVMAPRQWNSPSDAVNRRLLSRIDRLDAFVTLTERQRGDIMAVRGRTSNMQVVRHTVELPEPPTTGAGRDPHLVAVVARLEEEQKRLTDVIAAFERVVNAVEGARLDIYGSGPDDGRIRRAIENRGLEDSVTLRGHDPHAREALWQASAFMMTSRWECYPLATLESMSHGCPVVSYDIKYGPREQITDGVQGFLVPDGDVAALADRVVRLLRSPELVARMSSAARLRAAEHSPGRFIADWARVARAAVEVKHTRVRLEHIRFEPTRLRLRGGRLRRYADFVPSRASASSRLEVAGVLVVEASGAAGRDDLGPARVELAAVDDEAGLAVNLPLDVRRSGSSFHVRARVRLADLFGDTAWPSTAVWLRLRFTCRNAAWQTRVERPAPGVPEVELSHAPDRAVLLTRIS